MANKILKNIFDLGMLLAIFIMSIVEASSIYFQRKYDTGYYPEDNAYLYYYMPLLSSLTILIASSFFLFRIVRFKACIYTKIITISYFLNQLFTVLIIFIEYSESLYFTVIYPLYLITIFSSIIIKFIKTTLYGYTTTIFSCRYRS